MRAVFVSDIACAKSPVLSQPLRIKTSFWGYYLVASLKPNLKQAYSLASRNCQDFCEALVTGALAKLAWVRVCVCVRQTLLEMVLSC